MEAYAVARQYHLTPPTMEQPQYNLLHRKRVEHEYARLYAEIGLGTTIWSPLASGVLTGKYREGIPSGSRLNLAGMDWLRHRFEGNDAKRLQEVLRSLASLADEAGLPPARFALAWCLKNANVSTVILGASRVEQLQENLLALGDVARITPAILNKLEDLLGDEDLI
jgi:aryl-alcohol dehydrogenase-like predicted oxidoreductase